MHTRAHIRWSCNTQTVSGFAKDWIEPIVDKFKLPVGIGELIGSCSTVGIVFRPSLQFLIA